MNKETIKRYQNEFNHWLNEGTLLWTRSRDTTKVWTPARETHTDFFSTNDEYYIYVINDEYVEFRKALAEGKTIQYNPITQYHNRWDEIKSISPSKTDSIKNYRIKQDEPRFKAGDWVRCSDTTKPNIIQLTKEYYPKNDAYSYKGDVVSGKFLTLWKPKQGEWCIEEQPESTNHFYFNVMKWQSDSIWTPIPYTGPIPNFILE